MHFHRRMTSVNILAPPQTKDGKVFSRNRTAPSILNKIPEDGKGFYTILHNNDKTGKNYTYNTNNILTGWQAYRGDQIHRKNSPT